ncbi:MAG: hypothetical protein BAJATHORv1_40117 [Candidatus Thorarchaeota archaeon]|nr:MAG: hypothetical protein BAJATHORv1_40117 [Candidatus Thorarchaeota archaeon]
MTLFTDDEMTKIVKALSKMNGNVLITFRQKYGPTKLEKLWKAVLAENNIYSKCISWWSSAGTIGLLECHSEKGLSVFGQWALADHNELLGIFEMSNEDIVNIREGFDSGNVADPAMRAIRIGETGDQD